MCNNSCNICDSLNFYDLYEELEFSYSICKDCGHVYQSNRKSQSYYNDIPYSIAQKEVTCVSNLEYDTHSKNRGSYIYQFIYNHIQNKKINSLLDIGSSYGGVSYYLNKYLKADKVVGITPDYGERSFNRYDGVSFIKSTYDHPIDGKFDVVILVHTLEHFIYPIEALFNVKNNLNEDGIFYIEVPNFYWEKSVIGKSYTPVHLSYFTKNDLLNMLKYSGFEVIKIKESKYWSNIKIIAKHSSRNSLKIGKEIFKNNKENWIYKLIKFKLIELFLYPVFKFIKKNFKILPNS